MLQFQGDFHAIIENKLYPSVKNELEVGSYIEEQDNGLNLFSSEVLQ